jgi:transposase
MFGLPGFCVLAAGEVGGELELLVETTADAALCPRCGRAAEVQDRRPHMLRDVAYGDRPVFVMWSKRIWRCRNVDCPKSTWTERAGLAAPRASLSNRSRAWAARRVGEHAATVSATARALGVGWDTVMGAVVEHGAPLVDDPARLDGVEALGVDEHAWQRANARRNTQFASSVVGLPLDGGPARLLDVMPGRKGTVVGDWLAERDPLWRERIRFAALDAFQGYRKALRQQVPHAEHVLDAFHAVKLGFDALDDVRRRVQYRETGHRGRTGDPLYTTRRLLRRRADRLEPRHIAKLETALCDGDPHHEVAIAWHAAQDFALAVAHRDRAAGKADALAVIDTYLDCPVPEVARFAKTLRAWKKEIEAYFGPVRVSNGPTEAVNLLIEKVRRVAHGFRVFGNYRLRLLLHCGRVWAPTPQPRRVRNRRPRAAAPA